MDRLTYILLSFTYAFGIKLHAKSNSGRYGDLIYSANYF